jgi:RND superfamily putative drug exporter
LLFAVVAGAFLSAQIVVTKEIGFGIAAAVLLDASVVRALLVPALMQLLRRWTTPSR